MGKFFQKLSLAPRGLRYKLLVAFVLMGLIPLLVLGYVVSNYLQALEAVTFVEVSVVILLAIVIAWLGFLLARNIVEPVIDISMEAKAIAEGDYNKRITVSSEDEIGELGYSINLMVRRIKDGISELKDYGEKTTEINQEIQKKMVVLTDLLHISDFMSTSIDLEKTLVLVLDKLANFYMDGFTIVYLSKVKPNRFIMSGCNNVHNPELLNTSIKLGEGFLGRAMLKKKAVVIDTSTAHFSEEYAFKNKHKLTNAVIIPIYSWKEARGVLIAGNHIKEFAYTNEDVNIIKIFAKQLTLAVQNHVLNQKAELLSVTDDLTGVYNKAYILARLDEEIGRALAYQRPCSIILVDLDDFAEYSDSVGQDRAKDTLRKIAKLLGQIQTEPIDKIGRIDNSTFLVLLPESNKKRALEIAERVSNKLDALRLPDVKANRVTASIGVSENPIDGATAEELLNKAKEYVERAKANGENKIKG